MSLGSMTPILKKSETNFVAPNAQVMGNVELGPNSSVWYGGLVRGDSNYVSIGEYTNLQDRVLVHGSNQEGHKFGVQIGNYVTVESGVTLHGCLVEDQCFIGVGATVLDGAEIGKGSMIGPGSLVTPGTMIGDGEFWAGSPARKVRDLTKKEIEKIKDHAILYSDLANNHREETDKSYEQVERELQHQGERLAALNRMIPATHAREWPREFYDEDPASRRAEQPKDQQ